MSDSRKCPQCGTVLSKEAPQGLCPECLLKAGLSGERDSVLESEATLPVTPSGSDGDNSAVEPTSPVSPRFRAPDPEQLSKRFPQLEILELLGQGGMGAVYKARQPALDRLVAVKILPPEVAEDPGFTERFTREARALAKLNHPNIVSIHDFGQVDGQFYFVMEFVDGLNLRQMLKESTLKPQEALAIVPQICEALQFAHDEGLVHRDIKPENILLDKKGRVKIADFGLAKLLGKTPADITLTRPGHVMGTPHYMAPEQMEHPLEVDHRADIYSLGVVFYEMLTGELPMGRFDPPSKKVQVDVRLDQVVLKSLEKDRERRYQHASEVKTDVETMSSTAEPQRSSSPPTAASDREIELPVDSSNREKDVDRRFLEKRVRDAANGLLATGVIACLGGPLAVLILPKVDVDYVLYPWMGTAVGPLIMIGALRMRNLEHYEFSFIAGVLALLPVSWSFPIGLPLGFWAILELGKPSVRAAFLSNETVGISHRIRQFLPPLLLCLSIAVFILSVIMAPYREGGFTSNTKIELWIGWLNLKDYEWALGAFSILMLVMAVLIVLTLLAINNLRKETIRESGSKQDR